MFKIKSRNPENVKLRDKEVEKLTDKINTEQEPGQVTNSIEANLRRMDRLFLDVDILVKRTFGNSTDKSLEFCIYFSDGVVDSAAINEHILEPLVQSDKITPGKNLFTSVKEHFLLTSEVSETNSFKKIIESVTYGDTILFIGGCDHAVIISTKNFVLRSVSEPEIEKVLSGPREGFTESIMINLSLIRRRLRTNKLKMKMQSIGVQTNTSVCVCYIDGIVNPSILKEVFRRISKIEIDGILDSNYISEYISEQSPCGIPTIGYTERPDVVVGKLLEGRIAIFVDGTPVVLTAPYLFIEDFQSNEDYYVNNLYATFSRILRIVGFFLTMTIPGVYIAIESYQHEILPAALMLNIAYERSSVPLPASIECFIMHICFDILREAGVRMPSQVGQALSIVGALVIGQAGVEAQLIAAPMIIVVAMTAITGLMIPKLSASSMICRYVLMILGSCFGMYGIAIGLALIMTHLLSLRSFGINIVMLSKQLKYQNAKDNFIRASWPAMVNRYTPFSNNLTRAKKRGGG